MKLNLATIFRAVNPSDFNEIIAMQSASTPPHPPNGSLMKRQTFTELQLIKYKHYKCHHIHTCIKAE